MTSVTWKAVQAALRVVLQCMIFGESIRLSASGTLPEVGGKTFKKTEEIVWRESTRA